MRQQPVIWSAASCDFPGAGAYVGLAQEYEHLTVARSLNPRQMRMFVGGRMQVAGEPTLWPVVYYAVRDPSSVRVEPIAAPPNAQGCKHARLHFRFDAQYRRGVMITASTGTANTTPSGFLVTVGLPEDRETEFFQRTIDHHQDQDWDDLFARLLETARTWGGRGNRPSVKQTPHE